MGETEPLNLVFMGTPDLAATVLRHLLAWPGGRVVAVYCQPDRPSGRGMSLKAPPVKKLALEYNLPVLQPPNFKNPDDVAQLGAFEPDYLLVAAYGLILPKSVLAIPKRMALNVHTSLLPLHRGAAPIQRAIMNGDTETGVTIMAMEPGLDTGPVILQQAVSIGSDDTAQVMHDILADIGGKLLPRAIEGLESKKLTCTPQNDAIASYAAKLEKSDGRLDFSRTGAEIHAQARGVTPWPGAFGVLERPDEDPLPVNILAGSPLASGVLPPTVSDLEQTPPGTVLPGLITNAVAVRCADGVYLISSLRPSGRKAMDAAAFMNGYLKGRGQARFLPPPG